MKRDIGWVPVLKGKTYCSPRCGRGCTKADHDRAVEKSNALAKRLGPTWEPHVWENLGWHYGVTCGVIDITPSHRRRDDGKKWVESYACYIQTKPQFLGEAKTPEAAFSRAAKKLRDCFLELEASMSQVGKLKRSSYRIPADALKEIRRVE